MCRRTTSRFVIVIPDGILLALSKRQVGSTGLIARRRASVGS